MQVSASSNLGGAAPPPFAADPDAAGQQDTQEQDSATGNGNGSSSLKELLPDSALSPNIALQLQAKPQQQTVPWNAPSGEPAKTPAPTNNGQNESVHASDDNKTVDASNPGLAGRFVKGVVHGAVDMVWQPVAQVLDLGQVAYGVVYGLATDKLYEPHWFSAIGQNYEAGMSYGETVTRAVLGSNPVTGVGMASYDLTHSALQGDWGGVSEGLGGMAGGFAAAKYGQRYFAPEPGAELGLYRQRPAADVTDPSGKAPTLPGDDAANFKSAKPVSLDGRTLNRVYDNIKALKDGGYWAEQTYSSESAWRSGNAVLRGWNNTGTLQGTWTPSGGWGWEGPAAPQFVRGFQIDSWKFNMGWIQKGGDMQIYVPDSKNVIPPDSVISQPTPWSGGAK